MELHECYEDKIIESFYQAILEPTRWTEGLSLVSGFLECDFASIILLDRNRGSATLSQTYGMPEETAQEYHSHYCRCDPGIAAIERVPVGEWYLDVRELGTSQIGKSEFYQDFMRRHGQQGVMTNRLTSHDGVEGGLSLQRALGRRPFGQADIDRSKRIIPHLQRAIAIYLRLQNAAYRESRLNSVIDLVCFPLVTVDRSANVIHANAAAEDLIRRRIAVDVIAGRLTLQGSPPGCLLYLIRRACGVEGAAQAGETLVSDKNNVPIMHVVVTPLVLNASSEVEGGPFSLVVLQRVSTEVNLCGAMLRDLYRLTPAETRLSLFLLEGATLKEAAKKASVSLNTVRTQLKSIFAKTGTARQVDLVRKFSVISSARTLGAEFRTAHLSAVKRH